MVPGQKAVKKDFDSIIRCSLTTKSGIKIHSGMIRWPLQARIEQLISGQYYDLEPSFTTIAPSLLPSRCNCRQAVALEKKHDRPRASADPAA